MIEGSVVSAYKALDKGDLKLAHSSFMNLISKKSDNEQLYQGLIGLSITLNDLGEIDDTLEVLKKAVTIKPNPKEAFYNLGNIYEKQGEHALAIQNYDLAISIDPNYIDASINRGVAWFNLNKYEQSLRDFKNALKIDPENSRALSNTGITYLEDNRYEMSIDYFDRSLEKDPENIHSLCGKGLALFKLDQYDESVICFDAALSINPEFYIANFYKGHILKKLDLLDEAEDALLEAIGNREDYSLAWFELGELHESRSEDNKALKAYDKAIKYQDDLFEKALYQKGKLLSKKGRYIGAIKCYKDICKENPYIPDVWLELGKSLSNTKGNENKALSALKNAHYLKPTNPEITYHLGLSMAKMDMKKESIELLEKGYEKSNDKHIALLLSKLYYEFHKFNDAILIAEEIPSQDPEYTEALLVMGRSYGKIGKSEEYKQCLRKYLHIKPGDKKISKELDSIK